jgi:hypothetical protein
MNDSKNISKPIAKALCFVVGPIGKDGTPERKHSDLLLNVLIKEVLQQEGFDYQVKRADEDADPGMIGDRVVSDIINADLVVADLIDLNPNAFYELGIRHSTLKPTVHMARTGTPLPFDTITHRTIFFDLMDWNSIESARARLADAVRAIKRPAFRVSNPITQANASFTMRQSEDPRDQVLAEMQERMSKLESNSIERVEQPSPVPVDFGFIQALCAALATDDRAEAARAYQVATGTSLATARGFINAIRAGQKIEAIKAHRAATGLGLRDSKDFVEQLMSFWSLIAQQKARS